ncbi:MAG TPA: ATP-binding protein [Micromonosporaceae bacterium]|jgi:anti-sigma regulatory factor (Ser/Thr protein kinase)|nr:ATP-binding protein [Micromonosporaceae bacterium]
MATVRLSFSPAPAHVRTARLVGVAVARRAGVAEELLDEVRLAIGEACSRAVALHQRYGLTDLVTVEMTDDPGYMVQVTDRAPAIEAVRALPDTTAGVVPDGLSEEAVTAGMALALLTGLVDELRVRPAPEGPGTEVQMIWPAWRQGR